MQNKEIEKLIRTTMIGAIDRIEQRFGRFWGFGRPVEDRTDRQNDIHDIFMDLREDILDIGNDQIRKISND